MTLLDRNQYTMNVMRNRKMTGLTIRQAAIALLTQILLMQVATADGNWYVGAALGSADFDDTVDGFQLDTGSTAMRFYGGYSFNEHFSVDAGYVDLGHFDAFIDSGGNAIQISEDADGFLFAATGSIPLSDRFSLYGRRGSTAPGTGRPGTAATTSPTSPPGTSRAASARPWDRRAAP